MGNIGSMFAGSRKKMQTPRTPEELAATVDLQSDLTVEESIQFSPWASAFHSRLPDEEMRQLFVFLILCVALQSKDREKQEIALHEMHDRVFSDSQTWIANISFRDTENVVEDIFKLYESISEKENKPIGLQTQVQVKADTLSLQNKIVSLKQDRTLRNELEPVFRDFIKTSHLHPGSVVQQCLLSLL